MAVLMNESFADSIQQLHLLLISACSDTERVQNRDTHKKRKKREEKKVVEELTNNHDRGIEFITS